MHEFRGPRPNKIVIALCQMVFPFWLRFKERLSISVRGSAQHLTAFSKARRAVILMNHPDRQDPFAIFKLAHQVGEQFHCIVARECFDWDNGWRGWLFQRLGCYSVARGKADFHSIAMTKKILLDGQKKLVVFPEAEITADYEKLHHMQKAIFHIVLDVQHDIDEGKHPNKGDPVYIIPTAIKFELKEDLKTAVSPALAVIEQHLQIAKTSAEVHDRIDAVISAYLDRVFDSYGLPRAIGPSDKLAEHAATAILQKIKRITKIEVEENSTIEELYDVRTAATKDIEANSIADKPDAFYCAGLPRPCLRSDFERVERLLILERMLQHRDREIQNCRILDFIESELTGKISPKGRQTCVITPGAPIDMKQFVERYNESKVKAVVSLREYCRNKLQDLLNAQQQSY